MKTRFFILNNISVLINIGRDNNSSNLLAHVVYYHPDGAQIENYSLINKETQTLIEACIEVIVKEEGAILWSY